jgi:hypothetical protein
MVGRETVGAGVAVLVDVAVGFWAISVGVTKLLQPIKIKRQSEKLVASRAKLRSISSPINVIKRMPIIAQAHQDAKNQGGETQ